MGAFEGVQSYTKLLGNWYFKIKSENKLDKKKLVFQIPPQKMFQVCFWATVIPPNYQGAPGSL